MKQVLLDSNTWLRRVTGVEKWHKKGYYGTGIVAGTGENVDTAKYDAGGQIVHVLDRAGSEHAIQTAATFFQVAPEATLYSFSTNTSLSKH